MIVFFCSSSIFILFLFCKVYHQALINDTSILLPIILKGVPKREKETKGNHKKREERQGDEKSLLGQPHSSVPSFAYRQNPYRSDDASRLEPASRH